MLTQNLLLAGDDGYNLTKSLRFRSSASAYLNRTQVSSPTNNKKFTFSTWVKRGPVASSGSIISAGTGGSAFFELYFEGTTLSVENYIPSDVYTLRYSLIGGGVGMALRDPAAWYHIVLAVDTTQASGADGIKIYVNGVQRTWNYTGNYVQNSDFYLNKASTASKIGSGTYSATGYLDGYQAEINFIDGQQLTPSSFGSTNALTGVWQPAKYTGTYGTNGFYLPFTNTASTSTLGNDFSGNGNTWTVNNISLTAGTTYDSMTDVPTLTSATTANYAVMNPLAISQNTSGVLTLSNGNLTASFGSGGYGGASSTITASSGKFYAEFVLTASSNTNQATVGIKNAIAINDAFYYPGGNVNTYGYYGDGRKQTNDTYSSYGSSYTTNDVIGVALDMDAGTITFYKNNTSQGTAFSSLTGSFAFSVGDGGTSATQTWESNFGQRPFTYTPPTGFVALNTFNLPNSTIVKGNTVMDATLWTSNGGVQTITGVNFLPDFWWGKTRSSAGSNYLVDSVRGTSKDLLSNSTNAESTDANYVTAFNSNGFSMGTSQYSNGTTLVAWQWNAGNGSSSSNTSGSITSTVSVNPTAGFSVVTFTAGSGNQTVGHGLGVAPSMVILKRRNSTSAWLTYHSALSSPATSFLELNTTSAVQSASPFWGASGVTSTTFGTSDNATINGATYVAYCWSEIAGFSKFGSYTGNGSSDGSFLYLGFRPKYILIKSTGVQDWIVWDTARDTYNASQNFLQPNRSDAESGGIPIDFVSNGVKIRTANATLNSSGVTYIYMAFAENPFKNALAR